MCLQNISQEREACVIDIIKHRKVVRLNTLFGKVGSFALQKLILRCCSKHDHNGEGLP